KTNLLEAVYVLATSRSFRTSRLAELVDAAGRTGSVRAEIREDDERRQQSVGVRAGLRAVRVDGKRPETLAAYAVRTPVVAFHPGVVALTAGSGAERRKLLDRLALYLGPGSIADAAAYVKASRGRQRALEARGERASDVDGWEELMVRHGTALSRAREDAASRLRVAAERAFERIGPPGSSLLARYERRSPADAEAFRAALASSRAHDRLRGSASVGPHRDELVLELGGRPVRGFASQGQHRAVVLSLELAEIEVIAEARGVWPILLLDDVSSELDEGRMRALLWALRTGRGQVILTTTRPDLIDTTDSFGVQDRRDFRVVAGRITPV
ncbi:MAG TPA: DNA replication and repair protein RecF, partial [Polyangiaceae bacterium]|nr:DNA replication and repair protein RecF [Polyangiaceae bacterium]